MGSSGPAIQFERVSKRYDGHVPTFRESILKSLFGRASSLAMNPSSRELWALRDLSFAVQPGETLGIIGQNGAGKSTLLRLIAGITAPTIGHVRVEGRVATLIELGAGFNPDLTGRENIFLSSAVYGLRRREVEEQYDRIAAFSGLGHFLDIPVKYYSSGMYAKLGFSVAIHVKAEIIMTDEILAVGDALFQRQCLEKFRELKSKATILFVSHDLATVKKICTRALWLNGGQLVCDGPPEKVVEAYLESLQEERENSLRSTRPLTPKTDEMRWGSGEIELEQVTTHDSQGRERSIFRTFEDLIVRLHYRVNRPFRDPGFAVRISSSDGAWLHGTNTFIHGVKVVLQKDRGIMEVRYPRLPLLAGRYWLTAGVTAGNDWSSPYDVREKVHQFEVMTSHPDAGIVCLDHQWSGNVQV